MNWYTAQPSKTLLMFASETQKLNFHLYNKSYIFIHISNQQSEGEGFYTYRKKGWGHVLHFNYHRCHCVSVMKFLVLSRFFCFVFPWGQPTITQLGQVFIFYVKLLDWHCAERLCQRKS